MSPAGSWGSDQDASVAVPDSAAATCETEILHTLGQNLREEVFLTNRHRKEMCIWLSASWQLQLIVIYFLSPQGAVATSLRWELFHVYEEVFLDFRREVSSPSRWHFSILSSLCRASNRASNSFSKRCFCLFSFVNSSIYWVTLCFHVSEAAKVRASCLGCMFHRDCVQHVLVHQKWDGVKF